MNELKKMQINVDILSCPVFCSYTKIPNSEHLEGKETHLAQLWRLEDQDGTGQSSRPGKVTTDAHNGGVLVGDRAEGQTRAKKTEDPGFLFCYTVRPPSLSWVVPW